MIWGFRIIGGLVCGAQICRAPEFGRGKGAPRQEPMMRAYRPEQPAMPQAGFAPAPQGYDPQGYDPQEFDPQGYDPQGYQAPQEDDGYHGYAEAQGEADPRDYYDAQDGFDAFGAPIQHRPQYVPDYAPAPMAAPVAAKGFSAPPRGGMQAPAPQYQAARPQPAVGKPQMGRPTVGSPPMSRRAEAKAEKAAYQAQKTAMKAAGRAQKQAEKAARASASRPAPQVIARPTAQAAAPHHVKRDPAPSRMAYRLQRLWLTPLFRGFTRVGVPVFGVVLGLGLWLGDDGRRADLVERYDEIVRSVQERPEFMVSMLKIEGASPEVDAAIRTMMPVKLPASSFQIDLEAMHDLITRLDAVAEARLVIRDGGTLDVNVTERVPAILWRHQTGIEMLDAEGHRVATLLDRGARPDLPLIAGRGAEKYVPEALDILAAATPILPRARGVVRVGERRWDIVLDRGQRIMLPQDNPVLAVERLLAIDAAEDLMDRDFTHLDLRNQDRPTIRLSEAALEAFQTIKGAETRVKK